MEYHTLSGFEEFKNTEASKKLADREYNKEPQLKFHKQKKFVQIILNKALLRSMKDNGVFTFKLLFNEKTKQVAIKYDKSSNAMSIVNKRTRGDGSLMYQDKFVTATMLPLLSEDRPTKIYKCKFIKDQLIYIFN